MKEFHNNENNICNERNELDQMHWKKWVNEINNANNYKYLNYVVLNKKINIYHLLLYINCSLADGNYSPPWGTGGKNLGKNICVVMF